MAVNAVVAGVEFASDKPFPKGRITGVERGMPILIPVQQLRIVAEAFREVLLAEALDYRWIVQLGLSDEFGRGIKILFLFPVNGDLRFVLPGFRPARRRFRLPVGFIGGFAGFCGGPGSPWGND